MATLLPNTMITLRDVAAGRLPDGTQDREILELCAQNNPVLLDIPWRECQRGREYAGTVRTGLPKATWYAFYEGVDPSKSSKTQVINSCGMLGATLEIDARMANSEQDIAQLLLDEADAHMEGMGQEAATALFYGKVRENPKKINGFGFHYSAYTALAATDDKKAAFYCLNGAKASSPTTTDLRSVWLVGWGAGGAFGIYPKGSNVGLKRGQVKDSRGRDAAGKEFPAKVQDFDWQLGLHVRDFRKCGRICNLSITDLYGASPPDAVQMLNALRNRVSGDGVTQVLYMSRPTLSAIENCFYKQTNGNAISYNDLQQGIAAKIMGIRVAVCDALNVAEEQVPAAA